MVYRRGRKGESLSSVGYLEYLDERLGFESGTIHDLCLAAVEGKTKTKEGVKVTYRGEIEREVRLAPHRFVLVRRAIFLIEFSTTKAGKQSDRVIQVQLEV